MFEKFTEKALHTIMSAQDESRCNKVSGLRMTDGAIISGNRLVLRISGVGNNQTM